MICLVQVGPPRSRKQVASHAWGHALPSCSGGMASCPAAFDALIAIMQDVVTAQP